jgi:von Willebrand factor type A domain
MTFLTPFCLFFTLASLLPLLAALMSHARTEMVRKRLRLPQPERATELRPLLAASAVALAGFAAAQPALTRTSHPRSRTDVQAVFVLDTSRSMAASSSPAGPTRLDRAAAAAIALRNAIPDVPAGVLTLTDRVLPDLLPVADVAGFDGVVNRAVRIESPPPQATSVRATTFSALGQIASGDVFPPSATRRIVVLLTDGESGPVGTSELARSLSGYRFEAVRFWASNESVYKEDGRTESAYRPDPSGRVVLADLAASLGGKSFEQTQLKAATRYLRSLVGSGSTVSGAATEEHRYPLGPYVGLLALVALLAFIGPTTVRLTKQ